MKECSETARKMEMGFMCQNLDRFLKDFGGIMNLKSKILISIKNS